MSRQIERLFWFAAGILINSFGIVLITKGAMGTSQISSIPYVLSLQLPSISFGMFSFIMNMVYIVLQALLLRKQFKPVQLLQIVVNVVFSWFIDVSMNLLGWLEPQNIAIELVLLLLGCAVLGFGISVEVMANLVTTAGEGIVLAICKVAPVKFGNMKMGFDITLVCISVVLSLIFLGGIEGVREGTLAAMIFVGQVTKVTNKMMKRVGDVVLA